MDHFYNAPDDLVAEILEAEAYLGPVRLSSAASGMRLMLRADWDKDRHGNDQVAVLSGGGSGHEPAHAGFVGEGMLTGAIAGNLFASPSVEAVLSGIREVCGQAGCLLIVKNYTGDRLNFGLAAERARGEGLAVEMVIVADDIALEDAPQPRGIAGTVAVHKVAGYHAAQGESLAEVARLASEAAGQMASLGMALRGASMPGQAPDERSPELGLGIHNEAGAQRVSPATAREAMSAVLTPLLATMGERHDAQTPMVALLNNLGGCATQEMNVLAQALLAELGTERLALLVGPAPLMTSLDMHGFSVTLMAHSESLAAALNAPTAAPGWPGVRRVRTPQRFEPAAVRQASMLTDAAPQEAATAHALRRILDALSEAREALDELDARSGDGDAGSSMASGAAAIGRALEAGRLDTRNSAALMNGIGELLARDMGGSSGVLLSIFATAAGAALGRGKPWGEALGAAVEGMQHYGGARPGDRTMIDALVPAIEALKAGQGLGDAAAAARQGADATARLKRAAAGRSAYVPESALDGVTDPGAEAVALAFAALCHGDD
ncbi:dihydroxyacetone kinase subunit DhaK [Halomonas sp. HP20-15]|uniref:dihydroxyacetone kinase subunit DhaK n=1 Tax=Halomonas sp. HP20-15 TaxID=3085901 RepID=UPI00298248DC|nr:dihydroxyacetone kinase subunit DhaK [Halomonas sp. HP20-15]MDW5376130.1 dihydroxyacetone kinase subunit DhaK [Halomonas sp. HP20-15]